MTDDELAALERKADDEGSIAYADAMRLIAYVRTVQARNANLGGEARRAENMAAQLAVPLGHVRVLVGKLELGEVEKDAFVSGVRYWVTQ